MPETDEIVINTGPLLALIAGTGNLTLLQSLYRQVLVPDEVVREMLAGGPDLFGVEAFHAAQWLVRWPHPTSIAPLLRNLLDVGEGAVIQLALNEKVPTVCIDEAVGRRIARLSGLNVTGSVGILLRARREGHSISLREAIQRMRSHGVWLSDRVIAFALAESGEADF